jgi:hypothetical protein
MFLVNCLESVGVHGGTGVVVLRQNAKMFSRKQMDADGQGAAGQASQNNFDDAIEAELMAAETEAE